MSFLIMEKTTTGWRQLPYSKPFDTRHKARHYRDKKDTAWTRIIRSDRIHLLRNN